MMKRLLTGLLIIALLAVLGACGSQPAPAPAAEPAPSQPAAQPAAPAPAPAAPAAPAAETPAPAPAEPARPHVLTLTLAGASPGGLWSLLGEGVNQAIAEAFPGSAITYQTTGGGLANVGLVSGGQAEMGIVHNVEMKVALDGADPFSAPVTNLRAIAYMYNWAPHQFVITQSFARQHGITSVRDIAEKKPPLRVAVNQRGNMVEAMNREIFAAYGFTYEDIESWGGQVLLVASGEMTNLIRDRRIDMFGNSVFAPHSSIIEAGQAVDVTLLPLEHGPIATVNRILGSDPFVVPASAYDWLDRDVPTVAMGAMIVVSEDFPDNEAYWITRALIENIDTIRGVHRSMADLTPELMAGQAVVEYHPGALQYYREAGLLD